MEANLENQRLQVVNITTRFSDKMNSIKDEINNQLVILRKTEDVTAQCDILESLVLLDEKFKKYSICQQIANTPGYILPLPKVVKKEEPKKRNWKFWK